MEAFNMSLTPQEIGKRVKELRKKRGLTQEQLAHLCGFKNKSSVNHIENGRNIPQSRLEKIAEILETTPMYLMGYENQVELEQSALIEYVKKTMPENALREVVASVIERLVSEKEKGNKS